MKESLQKLLPSVIDVVSGGGMAISGAVMADQKIGDPTTNAVMLSAAQPFVVRLVEWFCDKKNTDEFRSERDRNFFDEVQKQIINLIALVNSKYSEADRRAQHTVSIYEAIILIEQYRDHAARSVLDERRKLLAAAAAATFRPDVEIEMKARAERALAILEPSDIDVLRKWVKESQKASYKLRLRELYDEHPPINRLTLEQSGCITIQSEIYQEHYLSSPPGQSLLFGQSSNQPQQRQPELFLIPHLTPLGEAVLRLLETYKTSTSDQA